MKKIFDMMQITGIVLAVAVAGGMEANLMPMIQSMVSLTGACALAGAGCVLAREGSAEK